MIIHIAYAVYLREYKKKEESFRNILAHFFFYYYYFSCPSTLSQVGFFTMPSRSRDTQGEENGS